MSNLPEQFSAARKAQLEAQLDAFRHFSGKAVENTEKLIALNLKTTRASVEKSTAALQQLLAAKDPRDLFALTAHSRDSFDTLLDYSRALFGIAGSARADASPSSPSSTFAALAAPGAAREPANDEAHGADDEDYSEDYDDQAAAEHAGGVAPDARDEPIIVSLRAADEAQAHETGVDPLPLAEASPIARAAASVAGATHETPAAAPLAADDAIQIDVSGIKPVDATPPPAPYSGKPGTPKVGETSPSKGARRK
ncbi:phasin family protein [Massilia atriviolacea]|uniref:Phasin family protein n=1 Tax=Massilia atriviolacea TaxID=2495579 RepID=A0A430HJS4_9BURK|nr:phasin family protein [Massilia atriviolacea]RSZ57739.1 phasin family protein [Massilia atriviolacea]